jgi:hypothetical protein
MLFFKLNFNNFIKKKFYAICFVPVWVECAFLLLKNDFLVFFNQRKGMRVQLTPSILPMTGTADCGTGENNVATNQQLFEALFFTSCANVVQVH